MAAHAGLLSSTEIGMEIRHKRPLGRAAAQRLAATGEPSEHWTPGAVFRFAAPTRDVRVGAQSSKLYAEIANLKAVTDSIRAPRQAVCRADSFQQ